MDRIAVAQTFTPTEQADGRSCHKCRFFGVMPSGATVCRFNPPVAHAQMFQRGLTFDLRTAASWPAVGMEEWCGKFEARPQA